MPQSLSLFHGKWSPSITSAFWWLIIGTTTDDWLPVKAIQQLADQLNAPMHYNNQFNCQTTHVAIKIKQY